MSTLLLRAGVTCQQLANQDFLTVDPQSAESKEVKYILLDPSCSGSGNKCERINHYFVKLLTLSETFGAVSVSGMVCLRDEALETQEDGRLQSLAAFQLRCLNHALQFPHVQRVVYSTCSVHSEENENVVSASLQQNSGFRSLAINVSIV